MFQALTFAMQNQNIGESFPLQILLSSLSKDSDLSSLPSVNLIRRMQKIQVSADVQNSLPLQNSTSTSRLETGDFNADPGEEKKTLRRLHRAGLRLDFKPKASAVAELNTPGRVC